MYNGTIGINSQEKITPMKKEKQRRRTAAPSRLEEVKSSDLFRSSNFFT
jgi:hypothetical protein